MSECIQSTLDTIRPAYRYQLFPLEKVQQGIAVTGTGLVLTGTSIVRHLEGCDSAYLLAGTIGLAHEQLLRKTMLIRPDAGVVLDSCGSAAAEAVAQAKAYLTGALRSAAKGSVGHGHGPVDHFWFYGDRWGEMA